MCYNHSRSSRFILSLRRRRRRRFIFPPRSPVWHVRSPRRSRRSLRARRRHAPSRSRAAVERRDGPTSSARVDVDFDGRVVPFECSNVRMFECSFVRMFVFLALNSASLPCLCARARARRTTARRVDGEITTSHDQCSTNMYICPDERCRRSATSAVLVHWSSSTTSGPRVH